MTTEVARVIPRRGRKSGPEIRLEQTRMRIGARTDCDLTLQGDFVSDVHATLEQEQGQWVLTNLSPHGTYVNRNPVTRHMLQDGDQIQVGAENLLSFAAATRRRRAVGEADEPRTGLVQLLKLDNPAALAGLVLYGLVMLAGVVFLVSRGEPAAADFSRGRSERILEATAETLASEAFSTQASPDTPMLPAGDPAALYHRLLRVAAAGDSESQATLADELTRGAGRHLTRGWHLEGQGRWQQAAQEYAAIIERLPDQRIAVTRLALERRRIARGRAKQ